MKIVKILLALLLVGLIITLLPVLLGDLGELIGELFSAAGDFMDEVSAGFREFIVPTV